MCYTISMATPISPNTSVYLLKCPLELDNQHQLTFASRQAQHNYFMSLPKMEFDKFSYQRQDGVLRVEEHIDNLLEYNYVMYQNENYTDRWFYAYITGMEYVNDNCTFVSIKTDVMQTWFPDLTFKRCFVEREHVNNDTFGLHTLEENIPSGEFVCNNAYTMGFGSNSRKCYCMVMLSELPTSMQDDYGNNARIYGGIPNGCYLVGLEMWVDDTHLVSFANINNLIEYYDSKGKSDAIVAMFLVPESFYSSVNIMSFELGDGYSFDGFVPTGTLSAKEIASYTFNMNPNLNGYVPKNKKCFTKQFNYLLVSNNAGSTATYNWEDFQSANDKDPIFKIYAVMAQNFPSKLVPLNYKNATGSDGYAYSVSGTPFPIVSWSSDYYLNWQAKNGWKGVMDRASTLGNNFGEYQTNDKNAFENFGDFLYNAGMGVAQEFVAIGNTISGSMGQAEKTPYTVQGNAENGDITFSMSKCGFTFYQMSVRAEVAKVVDDYFSAYGYKVSTWKFPNFTGRLNWNYVKLNQVNVVADIPQTDLDEIKKILLAGITLWHNPATFLDYSQTNSIV